MLDLDLDLEADLGVDTVKQAELFASVREAYGIVRDDNLKLRDYPSLQHVIGFVMERAGGAPAAVVEVPPAEVPPAAATTAAVVEAPVPAVTVAVEASVGAASVAPVTEDEVRQRLRALVAEKTGYPEDMLDLDLDLEADLGVDTVKQAELFASVRAIYSIPRDENRKLRDYPTLAHVIRFVHEKRPDLDRQPPAPSPQPLASPARTVLADFDAAN